MCVSATLLKKCHYFYQFDELFGARIIKNVVIEDTLDSSLSGDVSNITDIDIDDTTTTSAGDESTPSTSRKGIYSRTGVSDIIELQSEMMKLKKEKMDQDMAFKNAEIEIKKRELSLKEREIELKLKEIESKEKVQILEINMKEKIAIEELKLKYKCNTSD